MSLINDLSTLTTIPISTLEKLCEKEQMCILHKFFENECCGEKVTYVDIGIGTLYIKHEDLELKYKFIPSKSFENKLIETTKANESPLINSVEEALKDRIMNTFKDLF